MQNFVNVLFQIQPLFVLMQRLRKPDIEFVTFLAL
jgi:hypothetical protein